MIYDLPNSDLPNSKGKVIKIINNTRINKTKLDELTHFLNIMSNKKIIPEFNSIVTFEDEKYAYGIIMEKYHSDLEKYIDTICKSEHNKDKLDSIKRDIETKLINLYSELLNLGYVCSDIKLQNIVISDINGNLDIRLIDIDNDFCYKTKNLIKMKLLLFYYYINLYFIFKFIIRVKTNFFYLII